MPDDRTSVMLERLVGLPRVRVLAVEDGPLRVHVETRLEGVERCPACDTPARVKDRDRVPLTDLPCFGRRAVLVWHKRRWRCPGWSCPTGSWTETDPAIASSRLKLTDRAGRWVTFQVGCHGRTVAEVASDPPRRDDGPARCARHGHPSPPPPSGPRSTIRPRRRPARQPRPEPHRGPDNR